jgi:hypothetical protein
MSDSPVIQLVIVPHRPIHEEVELDNDLNKAFALLLRYSSVIMGSKSQIPTKMVNQEQWAACRVPGAQV